MSFLSGVSGTFTAVQNYFWNNIGLVNKTKETENAQLNSSSLPSNEQLRLISFNTFDRFKDVWDFDNFWKRANTCDAFLCFAEALIARWPDDKKMGDIRQTVDEILQKNLSYFPSVDQSAMWADDFAWLGLMGLNAYKLLKRLGNETLAQEYLKLSKRSWENIIGIAYDNSSDAKPVASGCRNNSAIEEPSDGVKNTVVNASFMLLSTRLYRLSSQEGLQERDRFLDMAYRQWIWFSTWFELNDYGYLYPLKADGAALVQERPTAFVTDSSYQNLTHPDWSPGWVWSADQGLLLGGLQDLLEIKDSLGEYIKRAHPETKFDANQYEKQVKDIIKKLVKGIQKALIGETDKIFREAPSAASFSGDGVDYVGGRGVLIRYMDFKKVKELLGKELPGVDFTENVVATVNAIWSTRNTVDNQFQPVFTKNEDDLEYIKQFDLQWGSSDQAIAWEFSSDPKLQDGVCQAIGMDYLGALLNP